MAGARRSRRWRRRRRRSGRLVFASQAFLELVRWSPEELTQHSWLEVLFPEAHEREIVLREVPPLYDVGRRPAPPHRTPSAATACAACFDLDHDRDLACPTASPGLMAIAVDSSGHGACRSAAASAASSELVEDAPDIMMRVDALIGPHALHQPRHRAADRLHARGASTSDAGLFARIILPEQRPAWEASFSRLQEIVGAHVRSDGHGQERRARHPRAGALSRARRRGRVVVLEGVARDNTSLKQLEEIRQRNQERAALDRLKTQLLANVSHELRTPLVSIKGYNDLLLRGTLGPINARQRRGLEIAAANTQRLVELIETLLDLARREEGRLELSMSRFDLREAVAAAAAARR